MDYDLHDEEYEDERYNWEKEYQKSWEHIPEDLEEYAIQEEHDRRSKRRDRLAQRYAGGVVRRRMTRHLFIVIDMSETVSNPQERPMRLVVFQQGVEIFIKEYFDQNPISQLGIIVTRDSVAEKLTDLSGNPHRHVKAVKQRATSGEPSLQNSLEVALSSLSTVPKYGSREVLIVYGSLNTCDAGDVFETLDKCIKEGLQISVVGMGAEVRILREIAQRSKGTYAVALDAQHFRELLSDHSPPPKDYKSKHGNQASLVRMGFPTRHTSQQPVYCACHRQLQLFGFQCPRCSALMCELPTQCQVCGLTLVSSPHLARSYHHLFQVPTFPEVEVDGDTDERCCSCLSTYDKGNNAYQCPKCQNRFCGECDAYIHESLHNCPGCESTN